MRALKVAKANKSGKTPAGWVLKPKKYRRNSRHDMQHWMKKSNVRKVWEVRTSKNGSGRLARQFLVSWAKRGRQFDRWVSYSVVRNTDALNEFNAQAAGETRGHCCVALWCNRRPKSQDMKVVPSDAVDRKRVLCALRRKDILDAKDERKTSYGLRYCKVHCSEADGSILPLDQDPVYTGRLGGRNEAIWNQLDFPSVKSPSSAAAGRRQRRTRDAADDTIACTETASGCEDHTDYGRLKAELEQLKVLLQSEREKVRRLESNPTLLSFDRLVGGGDICCEHFVTVTADGLCCIVEGECSVITCTVLECAIDRSSCTVPQPTRHAGPMLMVSAQVWRPPTSTVPGRST